MRKLDIRSIRAPSGVRLKLIELNALPQTSPVCGLIRISEVERLAKSYGVIPPDVFYDVFLSKGSDQKPLSVSPGFHGNPKAQAMVLQSQLQGSMSGKVRPGVSPVQTHTSTVGQEGIQMSALVMSSAGIRGNDVGTEAELSLVISIPRHLTPFKVHPSREQQLYWSTQMRAPKHSSGSSVTHYGGYSLQNLAKKITQKSRKFTCSSISGSSSARNCLACNRINPAAKKRCQFCGEFLIGRPCPTCGTLNHNRTRECFRCNSSIPYAGEGVFVCVCLRCVCVCVCVCVHACVRV